MSRPLHQRIGERWVVDRRLTRSGAAALLASLIAAAVGASAGAHGLVMLACGAVAAAWRVQQPEREALRWIAERAGLAYETALQNPAAPGAVAPILASLAVQGRLSVRDVRLPTLRAWGVPMWVLAALLLVAAPREGALTRAFNFSPSAPTTSASELPAALPLDAAFDDAAAQDAAAFDAAEGANEAAPQAGQGATAAAGDARGDAGNSREVIDRFVERLRDDAPPPPPQTGRAPVNDEGADAQEGDSERANSGEGEQGTDPTTVGASGAGEGGDEGEVDAGDDATRNAEGDPDATSEPTDGGDAQARTAGGEAGVNAPDPSTADFDPDGLGGEGQEGEGAGLGVGDDGRLESSLAATGNDAEALPSLWGEGETLPVGRVQQEPGQPAPAEGGFAPTANMMRAVEQALLEGALPVPYQEIVRGYFAPVAP